MNDETDSAPQVDMPEVDGLLGSRLRVSDIRWFCKRKVLKNFKTLDIVCHLTAFMLHTKCLLSPSNDGLLRTSVRLMYIVFNCVALQNLLSDKFYLENRISLVDAKYHRLMLWGYFLSVVFSLMISFYELQVRIDHQSSSYA